MNTKDNHTGWSVFLWVSTLTLLSLVSMRALFDTERIQVTRQQLDSKIESKRRAFGQQQEKTIPEVRRGERTEILADDSERLEADDSQLFRAEGRQVGMRLSTLWSVGEKSGLWGRGFEILNSQQAATVAPANRNWLKFVAWERNQEIASSLVHTSRRSVQTLNHQLRKSWTTFESRWALQQARIQVQTPETGVTPPAPSPTARLVLSSPAQESKQPLTFAQAKRELPWFLSRPEGQKVVKKQPKRIPVIAASNPSRSAKAQPVISSPAEVDPSLRWPTPKKLITLIEAVQHDPQLSGFAKDTRLGLARLRTHAIGSEESRQELTSLGELSQQLQENIDDSDGSDLGVLKRRLRYEFGKRLLIWNASQSLLESKDNQASSAQEKEVVPVGYSSAVIAVLNSADAIENALSNYSNGQTWIDYLAINELRSQLEAGYQTSNPSEIAISILSRFDRAPLGIRQTRLLDQPLFQGFREALLKVNSESASIGKLLDLLEAFESRPLRLYERKIQHQLRLLEWANESDNEPLVKLIDEHYRNANLRVSVGEGLANRWLPDSPAIAEPVTDTILGAAVRGQSQTSNSLSVDFIPDSQYARLAIYVRGRVTSATRASRDGFIFHNRGMGEFVARKEVALTGDQVRFGPASVSTTNHNSVVGLESSYDSLPIISTIARSLAIQNQNDKAPLAKRIVERKIGNLAQTRFEEQVQAGYDSAAQKLNQTVIAPLDEFAIRAEPIQAQTTNDRLTMRYRIAGNDQLSAHTPRPRALASSEASLQIHQSTLNNLVKRLQLDGVESDLPGLYEYIGEALGRELVVPDDIDPNVVVRFAPTDSISFSFEEERIDITIRMSELRIGTSSRWKNLTVTARLMPVVDGLYVQLMRDPDSHIGLPGRRIGFRDQVSIRTIFNKVFDQSNVIPVTPESLRDDPKFQDLTVSQLEIRDGWIGVSINAK